MLLLLPLPAALAAAAARRRRRDVLNIFTTLALGSTT